MKFLTGGQAFICEHGGTTQNKPHIKHKKGALIETGIFTKARNNRLLVRSIAGTAVAASLSYGVKHELEPNAKHTSSTYEATAIVPQIEKYDLPPKALVTKALAKHLRQEQNARERVRASRSQQRKALKAAAANHDYWQGDSYWYRNLPQNNPERAEALANIRLVYTVAHEHGLGNTQVGCLDNLWSKESQMLTRAGNLGEAYGIPQALPGNKMASKGSDWETNPVTQIEWGIWYIDVDHAKDYGNPCGAWQHSINYNWY